eukprot:3435650-Amphidinium_carterae.1
MVDDEVSRTGIELQKIVMDCIQSDAISTRLPLPKDSTATFDLLSVQLAGHSDINSLKLQPLSTALPLDGTFALNLSACYNGCYACIARTVVINPSALIKKAYLVASKVHTLICSSIKAGVVMKGLYQQASELVQEQSPDLLPYLAGNLGFATGAVMVREDMQITSTCNAAVASGMSICVTTTFGSAEWIVRIADTVLVPLHDGGINEIPTNNCSSKSQELMYETGDDDASEEEPQPVSGA